MMIMTVNINESINVKYHTLAAMATKSSRTMGKLVGIKDDHPKKKTNNIHQHQAK